MIFHPGKAFAYAMATVALNNYEVNQPVYLCVQGGSSIPQPVEGTYVELLSRGEPVIPIDGNSSVFGLIEPGFFFAGVGLVPGAQPQETVEFTLRVWRGAPSWEAAWEKGSVTWSQATGSWDPDASPPQPPTGPPLLVPFGLATSLGPCGGPPWVEPEVPLPQSPGRASAPSFLAWGYEADLAQAESFYAEAKVEKTSPGTFYAVILGDSFYFGLQHGGSGFNKHVHFAVWDPADSLQFQGEGVKAQRFGGEGTGWTIYYPFEWKTNINYAFLTQITPNSAGSTSYRAYFYDPESGRWSHLATVRRTVPVKGLNYFGSFIEDFGEKGWLDRSFLVGRQWARLGNGQWLDLKQAYFNCSIGWSIPYTNSFDGDQVGEFFRLETGGRTTRDNQPGDVMQRETAVRPMNLPIDPPLLELNSLRGQTRLEMRGAPGLVYEIQYSTNLVAWNFLTNAPLSKAAQAAWDLTPPLGPGRFYRCLLRQP